MLEFHNPLIISLAFKVHDSSEHSSAARKEKKKPTKQTCQQIKQKISIFRSMLFTIDTHRLRHWRRAAAPRTHSSVKQHQGEQKNSDHAPGCVVFVRVFVLEFIAPRSDDTLLFDSSVDIHSDVALLPLARELPGNALKNASSRSIQVKIFNLWLISKEILENNLKITPILSVEFEKKCLQQRCSLARTARPADTV
jgi:hypothetical protein